MAQTTSIARSETTSRRTQDHSFDAATMSPPEQLGDRTAHRVSHANKAIDHERIRECRNVIGTIRESERDSDPHPPSVTAMIDDQYAIGATERLEYRSPVEQACRAETMQEQQGRRIRRPCGLAHENLAATRKRDSSFSPTHRRRICIGMTSSITKYEASHLTAVHRFVFDVQRSFPEVLAGTTSSCSANFLESFVGYWQIRFSQT